jgi:hypothetical protein
VFQRVAEVAFPEAPKLAADRDDMNLRSSLHETKRKKLSNRLQEKAREKEPKNFGKRG